MIDYIFIGISILLLLIGYIGCFLPIIPGPMIAFFGVFLLHFTSLEPFSRNFLVIRFVIHIIAIIFDNFIPTLGTKLLKGSKRGVRGSTIGIVFAIIGLPLLGIVTGPFGIFGFLLGPFVGAYIGEIIYTGNSKQAIKSALGSFFGFLSGLSIKLILTSVMAFYLIQFIF